MTCENMRGKPGFALFEVILVILLLGVFAYMALPRLGIPGNKTAVTSASRLVADLRFARSLAITTGKGHSLRLLPDGVGPYNQYEIKDNLNQPVGDIRDIPANVTCTVTVTNAFNFNYLGECNSGSIDTITLVDGSETSRVIVIDLTGRAYY